MLSLKIKDLQKRKNFSKHEKINKIIKFLFVNQLNKKKSLVKKRIFFNKITQKHSKVRINNRCVLHNRGRGSIKNFSLNRILLRDMFSFGLIPGYKKAVW